MVYTERGETAAVSCGTSHASAVSTPLPWIFKNANKQTNKQQQYKKKKKKKKKRRYKKLVIHVEAHDSARSLQESEE